MWILQTPITEHLSNIKWGRGVVLKIFSIKEQVKTVYTKLTHILASHVRTIIRLDTKTSIMLAMEKYVP